MIVDSCRSRTTCIGHWVFFFLRKRGFDMFWWHQLHSTSSLGVPGRTADRRWFQVCNDHRHGDLSGIVLANSGRGSLWFPPASKGYQFIYMDFFLRNHFTTFSRENSFGENLLQVFLGACSQKNIPVKLVEVHDKWFVANTSCVPAPLAIGATNPPGSFLQGKACIKMPRQRWSLALLLHHKKGAAKAWCSAGLWDDMRCSSCLMDDLCEHVIFTCVGQKWLGTLMHVLGVAKHKTSQCVFVGCFHVIMIKCNPCDYRSHDFCIQQTWIRNAGKVVDCSSWLVEIIEDWWPQAFDSRKG